MDERKQNVNQANSLICIPSAWYKLGKQTG